MKPLDRLLDECDVVIEVVDARDVDGTRSRALEEEVEKRGKTLIIAVNKSDLAAPKGAPRGSFIVSAKVGRGVPALRSFTNSLLSEREEIRVGIAGYANVGKSALINSLGGRAKASPRAGFTRGVTWSRLSKRVLLMDSPGIIPRSEEPEELVLKSAMDVSKLRDAVPAACRLIERLGSGKIARAYGAEPYGDAFDQLQELAGKWRMLLKKGELDTDRAARRLLTDWQRGKIR
jgi:ribosome biogenesis GTPase A